MSTLPLVSLQDLPLASISFRGSSRDFTQHQRLNLKYERMPLFKSYTEEIEWRLSCVNVQLSKNENLSGWRGIGTYWIRIALLAGFRFEDGYLFNKRGELSFYFSLEMRNLWDETFEEMLFNSVPKFHKPIPQKEIKTYLCFDSYGSAREVQVCDYFDLIQQVFNVSFDIEEQKRYLSMLINMKIFTHRPSGLKAEIQNDQLLITQKKEDLLFEIVAIEKKEQYAAQSV